jgi:5-methylcytosine-specific restriction endonuclease McrA
VHHIITKAQKPEDNLDNLVLLCHDCHINIVHKDGASVWKDRLVKLRKEWIEKYG